MNKLDLQFSLFYKEGWGIKNITPHKHITFDELIKLYQHTHLKTQFNKILDADPQGRREIKNTYLPYITPYGTFSQRRDANIIHHNSNLLCVDIDELNDKAVEIQEHLSTLKGCVMSVLSPRLDGVKAFFVMPSSIDPIRRYKHTNQNIEHIVTNLQMDGYELDPAQFILSQAMYVGYSNHMFFNVDAGVTNWDFLPYIAPAHMQDHNGTSLPKEFTSYGDEWYNRRIELYLDGQCERLINTLSTKVHPGRHKAISYCYSLATWKDYASDHFMEIIRAKLLNAVIRMYGTKEDAINENAIESFDNVWNTRDRKENEIIEDIIKEYKCSINLKSLEQ